MAARARMSAAPVHTPQAASGWDEPPVGSRLRRREALTTVCAVDAVDLAGQLAVTMQGDSPHVAGVTPGEARRSPWLVRVAPQLIATAAYLLLGVVVTWPLLPHFATHLPLGSLGSATVPWFNLWTLSWNADRLQHGMQGYWDAPIFFPTPDCFALSEPQTFTGFVFALLRTLMQPAAAYNAIVLGSLVLNGLAARHLLRVSGVSARAATLAGLLAVAASFALKELGVLQLLALYGPLMVLAELCRLARGEGRWVWVRMAAWCGVTLWTCIYFALLLGPLLGLGLVVLALCRALPLRPYGFVLAALLLGLAAAAPLLQVQGRALAAHPRSAAAVRAGSASAWSYLRLKPETLGARIDPWLRGRSSQRALFPGTALLGLAALGLVREARGPRRRWVWYCLGGAVLACILSFGTRWSIAGVLPYEWLVQRALPGFAQLRSPYRFAGLAQLLLLVPAGFGVEALLDWRRRAVACCVGLGLALLLLEAVTWPQPLQRLPVEQLRADWVQWLARQAPGPVAMIPPEKSGRVDDYEPVTLAMLQGLEHGHPLVEGYSGFFPQSASEMSHHLRAFPGPTSLAALARGRVRYAVVDVGWAAHAAPSLGPGREPPPGLQLEHASADKLVYRVGAPGSEP